jgi:hypothetical protein
MVRVTKQYITKRCMLLNVTLLFYEHQTID